jgi:hypothetical protein
MAEAHAFGAVRVTVLLGGIGVSLGACTSTIDGTAPTGTNGATGGAVGAADTCPGRSGSYLVTTTRVDGDCGELEALGFVAEQCQQTFCIPYANTNAPGTTTVVDQQFTACSGTVVVPTDNCRSTFSYECATGDGNTIGAVGELTWSMDGAGGTGSTAWTIYGPDHQVACHGNYTVAITRQ